MREYVYFGRTIKYEGGKYTVKFCDKILTFCTYADAVQFIDDVLAWD